MMYLPCYKIMQIPVRKQRKTFQETSNLHINWQIGISKILLQAKHNVLFLLFLWSFVDALEENV